MKNKYIFKIYLNIYIYLLIYINVGVELVILII